MRDQRPGQVDNPQPGEQFVQIFRAARDDLFAYIFSLVPHWSDAEDLFQQTSLVLWQRFGQSFSKGVTSGLGVYRSL